MPDDEAVVAEPDGFPTDMALLQLAEERLRAQIALRPDEQYVALLAAHDRLAALRRSPGVVGPEPVSEAVRQFVLACRTATYDRTLAEDQRFATPGVADATGIEGAPGQRAPEVSALIDELRGLNALLLQCAEWMEYSDARLNAIEHRKAADYLLAAALALDSG